MRLTRRLVILFFVGISLFSCDDSRNDFRLEDQEITTLIMKYVEIHDDFEILSMTILDKQELPDRYLLKIRLYERYYFDTFNLYGTSYDRKYQIIKEQGVWVVVEEEEEEEEERKKERKK